MLELRGFKRAFKKLDARRRFLEACEQAVLDGLWSITAVARLAGVHRSAVYRWCKQRPGFRDEIDAAFERGYQRWRAEIFEPEQARRKAARSKQHTRSNVVLAAQNAPKRAKS